jgi:chromosome segregation ATPase
MVVRDPEDGVSEGSTEYHAKFLAPHYSSEGEVTRLELERQLSVWLAARTERDRRIAQLTEELALKSTLLEQAEATAVEAARRAGSELREYVDDQRLKWTSLVEQRGVELVDLQAKLDELVLSRDQQIEQYEKELGNVRAKLEANESELGTVYLRLADGEKGRTSLDELVASRDQQVGQYEMELKKLRAKLEANESELGAVCLRLADVEKGRTSLDELVASRDQQVGQYEMELKDVRAKLEANKSKLGAVCLRLADAEKGSTSLDELVASRDQQVGQYEKELKNVRARLEAKESELEAVRLRLTDAEKGLTKSKAEADTLRAQNATGSMSRDEDQVTRRLMERMRAIEAEVASKRWNEKSIQEMECRNEG